MNRWSWVLLTPLALAGLVGLAGAAAAHARVDWNLPEPLVPYHPGEGPPREQRGLLLVVIDGLRADEAHRMPALSALASSGASANLWMEGPTFSAPQYVALLTGVPPVDSGIRNNSSLHAVALDSVPLAVRRGGQATFVVSDEVDWWQRLMPSAWSSGAVVAPGQLVETVREHVGDVFVLAHLCGVDAAGHAYGAGSPEYRAAAAAADRTLGLLANSWVGVVAVVADHGHVARGGHGGDEEVVRQTWMVLAGEGVRAGASTSGTALDVAPTLAALVGVSTPGNAEGRTLTELVEGADPEAARQAKVMEVVGLERARARADEWRGRARRAGAVLPVLLLAGWVVWRGGRMARRGVLTGALVLTATALGNSFVWGPLSASAAAVIGLVIQNVGLLSFACAASGLMAFGRPALSGEPAEAAKLAAGFAVGASPAALASFVDAGAFVPRFTCLPAWRAVMPMAAYAAYGAALVVALVLMAAMGLRRLRQGP